MKLKKVIASLVSVAFLSLSFVMPVVAESNVTTDMRKIMPIEEFKPAFLSSTGVIEKVSDFHADDNAKFISIIDENGNPVNLIVNSNTYVVDNAKLTEGTQIIYFYDASRPMILIYPPQINPEVVAVIDDSRIIKVDTFNQNLVSQDGQLRVTSTKDSEIITRDNTPYTGELANHKLVVIYNFVLESLPAQTSPQKIIVLDDVTSTDEDLYDENYKPDVTKMNIVVDGDMVIIDPKAYTNDEGVVMVPLRVIVEALGYEVKWVYDEVNNLGKVSFNDDKIRLTIGEKIYVYNVPIPLDTAPTLIDNTTYVPLNFFTDVLLLNNAYVFEGQIDINNGEKME